MTMRVRRGGVWQEISGAQVFKSGAWRSLVTIQVYKSGAWREVANFTSSSGGSGGGISAAADEDPCEGDSGNSIVIAGPCTITPSGGLAPYTYAWSITSGSCTIGSPTSASTTFTKTGVPIETTVTAIAQCIVTDSLGSTVTVSGIDLSFTHSRP